MHEIREIEPHLRLGILDLEAFSAQYPDLKRRELESKGGAYLLNRLFAGKECSLYYDQNGKPHIQQPKGHISISHSHGRLAILFNSKENTGIDIELIRDKVIAIQHKFLSEQEQQMAKNDTETLVLFWAIKESLYKVYGKRGLDFKKHIVIHSHLDNPILAGIRQESGEELYLLRKEKLKDYMLVYAEKKV